MPSVLIDASRITDFETFHTVFAEVMGFPDYYGHNLDAWIDCMTYLDDPDAGTTSIHGTATDPVVLYFENIDKMPREVLDALNDCASFVNWRRFEPGDNAILSLAYARQLPE